MPKKVTAFAPATVANISVGFDVLGLAINSPGDTVTVEFNDVKDVRLTCISGKYSHRISDVTKKNTARVAAKAFLKALEKENLGIDIHLQKDMPLGSGLGSSGASAVASTVAINELFGNPFSRKELLPFVMEAEAAACGAAHADNVVPSLLGGIMLIRSSKDLDFVSLPVPSSLLVVVVHPHFELNTKDSREVLPKTIPLMQMVAQVRNIASFISSLFLNDMRLLKRSILDVVVEPSRSPLIPHFKEVTQAASNENAFGTGISGSGPSIFAFAESQEHAKKIGEVMQDAWQKHKIKSDIFISNVNTKGAFIINKE